MDKANTEWAKDIPCKNITIHGFCKFENDGCIFNHGSSGTKTGVNTPTGIMNSASKFNAKTASSFTPSKITSSDFNGVSGFTSDKSATVTTAPVAASVVNSPTFATNFNPYVADSFTPSGSAGVSSPSFNPYSAPSGIGGASSTATHTQTAPVTGFTQRPPDPRASLTSAGPIASSRVSTTQNFPTIYPPPHSILQYHLYAPDPPPHLKVPLKPNERTPETLFIPNDLREELVKKNQSALQVFPSGGSLPEIVGDYFGLVPLEFHSRASYKQRYMGHQNSLYKVFSNSDGKIYIMRRIHDVNITEATQVSRPFQMWQKVSCANVVKIKDAFITRAFNDSSLCVVHEYFPQSSSLYETHFVNFTLTPITQDYLWAYLVQLTNALKEVHSQNLSINVLGWDKVIVTGEPGRIKVSDCGVYDILHSLESRDIEEEQQKDFEELGKLLNGLVTKIASSKDTSTQDLKVDSDFKIVLDYLLLNDHKKNVRELASLFTDRILSVVSSLQTHVECTEAYLSRELENGRLFRLMCKLNFIFGRTESRVDINWSESGEKFPIILFYDYVFHQVDEAGKSIMDLTHVLRCLNKLDAGVTEKIMLVTPDEMNCIIISYKELKDLIDSTFRSMTQ